MELKGSVINCDCKTLAFVPLSIAPAKAKGSVASIWKQLVICPIKQRKFGMAASYPSSVGGMSILKK